MCAAMLCTRLIKCIHLVLSSFTINSSRNTESVNSCNMHLPAWHLATLHNVQYFSVAQQMPFQVSI